MAELGLAECAEQDNCGETDGCADSPLELGAEEEPILDENSRIAVVEALLFAHGEPLALERISQVTAIDEENLKGILEKLEARYKACESGIELVCVAGKFQLRTKPQFGLYLRELKSGRPRKLSAAALETLAIVAYRQPIVKSDIEKLRGVDATPTLKTLLDRRLISIIGHQATVGQPALYGTTEEFLKLFGLPSLAGLPTLREVRQIEEDPGEGAEADCEQVGRAPSDQVDAGVQS